MKKIIVVLLALAVAIGAYLLLTRWQLPDVVATPPTPAGTLSILTAKAGDKFGPWTLRENNIKPKEVKDFDGSVHTGPSGQITFTGSLSVHGSYIFNDLDGGLIFYPDAQYLQYFPKVVSGSSTENLAARGGKVAVALPASFVIPSTGKEGELTTELKNIGFQQVFCLACDGWQGFYIAAEPAPQPIGGQKDTHGCLGPGGYTFDEEAGACLRNWELTADIKRAIKIAVDKVGRGYALTVVQFNSYEEPGAYDIMMERGVERKKETVFVRNWQPTVANVQ